MDHYCKTVAKARIDSTVLPFGVLRTVGAGLLLVLGAHVSGLMAAESVQTVLLSPSVIVEFAVHNNPSMLKGDYAVRIAEYDRKAAIAAFLPHLSGNFSYVRLDRSPETGFEGIEQWYHSHSPGLYDSLAPEQIVADSMLFGEYIRYGAAGFLAQVPAYPMDRIDGGLSLTQPLFLGGRAINGFRATSYRVLEVKREQDWAREKVKLSALRLFWTYVGLTQGEARLRDELAWHERVLKDGAANFDAGLIIEDEVLRMRTALSFVKLALLRSQNRVRSLEETILRYCNLPPESRIQIDSSSLAMLNCSVSPVPVNMDEVLRNRNDMLALDFRARILEYGVRAARAAYLPHVYAAYNNGFRNSDRWNHERMVHESNVAVHLDWNLFDWGEQLREMQKARAALAAWRLDYNEHKREIEQRVHTVSRKVAEAIEVEKLAFETVGNVRRSLELAELRYREGVLTGPDLLRVRSDLTRAEQELIQARIDKVLTVEELAAESGEYSMENGGDGSSASY